MNRFKILKYTIVGVLLFTYAGCNDILEDPQPPTSVSGDIVLSSPDGVNALRASLYSQLRASFGHTTEYFIGPSAFADETRARTGASRFRENLNEAIGTSGTAHLRPYNATYSIILDANLLINAVEEGVLPQDTIDRYRGEAYAVRAFVMHHLVRSLGYEPGNFDQGPESNWDLGIIIRTEPTIDVADADQRARSTVDQVYAQILDDLNEAKTLLAGVTERTRFNEAFVDGMIARVNLYAGNWGAAAQAAQDAINISAADLSLASTEDEVANMFFETSNHTEGIFVLSVDPNTEPIAGNNTNNGPAAYTSTQWVAQVPTQMVLDLYEDEDFRIGDFVRDEDGEIVVDDNGIRQYEGGWYQPCVDGTENDPQSGCNAVNDDELSTNKFNGAKGNLADDLRYMRLAELYLIWAEAAAKDANSPAAGAEPLDALREARGLAPLATANPGALASMQAFEDEILNERMRELIVEGHRFWDLKRLGRDIRNPDGSIKMFADSYRILANIGGGLRGVNPELVENPGY